jgi:hypothetical protein
VIGTGTPWRTCCRWGSGTGVQGPGLRMSGEVHAFRLDCDDTQGGSEFSQKGCEWLGVTHGQLSQWDAVGRRAGELVGAPTTLPASEDSICRLASLDDVAFKKAMARVEPDMGRKAVRELRVDLWWQQIIRVHILNRPIVVVGDKGLHVINTGKSSGPF